jgi:hypothetical protein
MLSSLYMLGVTMKSIKVDVIILSFIMLNVILLHVMVP